MLRQLRLSVGCPREHHFIGHRFRNRKATIKGMLDTEVDTRVAPREHYFNGVVEQSRLVQARAIFVFVRGRCWPTGLRRVPTASQ